MPKQSVWQAEMSRHMYLFRFLFLTSLLTASLMGKDYFISQGDMCTAAIDHHCPNDPLAVKNLQIALMADKKLHLNIQPDGIWGHDTEVAVTLFQSLYGIEPADGWVGLSTKAKLDKVYHSQPFSFQAQGDICEEVDGQECPNDYEAVRNLQIVLNLDENLSLKEPVKVDGMFGAQTKEAIIAFQKAHGMVQIDGWIGRGSKRILDQLTEGTLFPQVPKRYRTASKVVRTFRPRAGNYKDFKKFGGYPRSYSIYKNVKLLKKANKNNTHIVVDISQQRIKLFVGNKVAIDSPCTTGAKRKIEPNTKTYRDKHTPKGHFKITEKIADKRSTIFGKLYRNGKLVWRGDRRKYHGPKAKYVGASLKNWMRLTSSGIGLHGSKYIKRYPATNGCVRVPYRVVKQVFKYTKVGTHVDIVP